ncbi:MAG: fasciclin domain-containing protein [Planctomycetales bacterium]|nr:fasciclin domain-containing protein [Planctomycetales bacterium]
MKWMNVLACAALVLSVISSNDSTSAAQAADKSTTKTESMTIVEVAAGNKDHTTLVAAVKAAGLAETLSGTGPFTVFAPTNAAFDALPKGTVEKLLKPESKETLVGILTYHVVPAKVMAAQVVKLDHAKTVQGQEVTILVGDQGVKVDKAHVVKTDIVCKNGVIHVIDAVLLPQSKK